MVGILGILPPSTRGMKCPSPAASLPKLVRSMPTRARYASMSASSLAAVGWSFTMTELLVGLVQFVNGHGPILLYGEDIATGDSNARTDPRLYRPLDDGL